ncbi:MAG: coproporphyrinogen III oxidase family protein [Candidatus Riflebacteria bacterium]|nr:coproporphyrinogen III oxidase family protein [Candidatus Riflebacteria bacterium]
MSRNILKENLPFAGNGLYVHVPFCLSKCDYCGFYSVVPGPSTVDNYLAHLAKEAQERLGAQELSFETVFIGGGNPTSIGLDNLKRLVDIVTTCLPNPALLQEWTFESNPETLTAEILDFFASLPAIRLSMGIQRLHDHELSILGRRARIDSVYRALDLAFSRIQNVSGDFIMGVPGCPSLADDLHHLVTKYPFKHVSAYFLTVEEDTPMQRAINGGLLPDPADVDASELYEVRDVLAAAGFEHYEISNHARSGFRCRHNLNYWEPCNYTGLGPSAVTTTDDIRLSNVADLERWLTGEIPAIEHLSPVDRRNEYLMLRLRLLIDGLDIANLERHFGAQGDEFYMTLGEHIDSGNLLRHENQVRLSDQGLQIADEVMASLFI